MVKQSRKQRKSQKQRQSRKQRKSRRNLRNRRSQRGGAAPFDAPYEALAGAARDAAQVAPLDRYISDLPGLIPRQGGGRYRQRNGNVNSNGNPTYPGFENVPLTNAPSLPPETVGSNVLVGGSAPFGDPYTYKLNGGRRYRRRNQRRSRRQRNQRGGSAPFDAPYSLGYKLPGVNEQFASEGSVNSLYSQNRGAQGY